MRIPSLLLWPLLSLWGSQLPSQSPPLAKLEIQKIQNLDFGGLKVGPEGGSVILDSEGARIPSGDIRLGAGADHPAVFRLLGPPNGLFSLQVTPERPLLAPPAGTLRVRDFRCSSRTFQGRFDGTGTAEVRLGGTLDVGALPKPGRYSGSQSELHLHSLGLQSTHRTFQILATLQSSLVLTNESPMDFGAWIAAGPGRVVVTPLGSCSSPDPNGPIFAGGRPSPAAFTMRAEDGTCYTLKFPDQITLLQPGSALGMQVSDFTSSIPSTGAVRESMLPFRIGATLHIGAMQAIGRYTGTFEVTVHYF